MALGLAFIPALAIGVVLESFDERYLEVPLVLLGLVWMYLGFSHPHRAETALRRNEFDVFCPSILARPAWLSEIASPAIGGRGEYLG